MPLLKKTIRNFNNDVEHLKNRIQAMIALLDQYENDLNKKNYARLQKQLTFKDIGETCKLNAGIINKNQQLLTLVNENKALPQGIDTDYVIQIIQSANNGIAISSLIETTGFAEKKVRNIVQRAYKAGKIERVSRGKYKSR